MSGLLDSGASRTIVGNFGWAKLRSVCKVKPSVLKCQVANGELCEVLGSVDSLISGDTVECIGGTFNTPFTYIRRGLLAENGDSA